MAQLRSLDISELDFDQIKDNLKAFLQNQEEFTDYDFEGSGLSILLDVLAYNTHYNAYLANMLANEMFLDSAVKRASAVSIAKHLGYTPISTRSARAVVNVSVENPAGSPTVLTLNSKTPFSTSLDGNTYTFYNLESVSTVPTGDQYVFSDVEIVEGTPGNFSFAVSNPGPDEKYEIPDTNIDTSTLRVRVQTSVSNTTVESYYLSTDTSNVTGTSKVYYLDENPSGKYEIYFGDGILGKRLSNGNLVNIEYLRSSGSLANTSNTITTSFTTPSVGGSSTVSVTSSSNPSGGRERDSLSDIKFKAPKVQAAKNRAVTASDFQALLEANYTGAESVSVWGGEDNTPPIYGKVFIALKPYSGYIISDSEKELIKRDIINPKKSVTITPEFVDPEYYYVTMTVNVEYDSSTTTKTSGEISTIVENAVNTYFTNELQKFNKNFKKSKLIKLIMDSDVSISSVIVLMRITKRFLINLNETNTYIGEDTIKLENPVDPGSLSSSRFYVASSNTFVLANFTDVPSTMPPSAIGTGTLVIRNSETNDIIYNNVGNVNYASGEVSVTGFTPTSFPSGINDFRVSASVQDAYHNLTVKRNQILVLDDTVRNAAVGRSAGLTINVTPIVE